MPHRLVSCLIFGFWLGTTGFLLVREWHQRWTAPPLLAKTIPDLATEPVQWHIFRSSPGPDGSREPFAQIGVLVSQVQREEANGLVTLAHQLELDVAQIWHHWPPPESAGLLRLESRLEIGLLGEMQRLRIVGGWSNWSRWLLLVDLIPRQDDQVTMRLMMNLPGGVWRQERILPWSMRTLPINTLGPPERIPGLRPGQRWSLPWVDALGLTGTHGGQVTGTVASEPVSLIWQDETHPCLVVQFQHEGLEAQWWVSQHPSWRDQVLQQLIRCRDVELLVVRQLQVARPDLLVPPAWFYRLP